MPASPAVDFNQLIAEIRNLESKRQANGCLSKRDHARLYKDAQILEAAINGSVIFDEDRLPVEDGNLVIRYIRMIHDLPEFKQKAAHAKRLGRLMLKIFHFRHLSDRSALNYYFRKDD